MVGVDGELRQDRWQQDGQNRSKVEIIANYIQLLGGGGGAGDRQNHNNSSGGGNSHDTQNYTSSGKDDGFTDDIPF